MKYNISDYTSAAQLLQRTEKMNAYGPRLTGNRGHKQFIEWLKDEIQSMGITVYSDPYYFDRWEEKSSSIVLHDTDEGTPIAVSSAFPYSGETGENGVRGELVYIREKHVDYLAVKDKIAVIKIDKMDFLPSTLAFDKRRASPETLELPKKYTGPVATAFVNFPFLGNARRLGAKAAICIWEGMSDQCVEGQYLPFILDYQGLPTLWVNETNGKRLIQAARSKRTATLKLTAEKEKHCCTETFYCMIEGKNNREAVIVNTHTDGTNCIEENGPIAMLSLIECLKAKALDRTHIFVFATGHFRLPMFHKSLGVAQATSRWVDMHKDLWDGKKGHIKAVAGVSVEHLGCMEQKDSAGAYIPTGDIETEMVYTGSKRMDDIYYRALEGRKNVRTVTLRGHNFLHFGEGQPLFDVKIPEIAYVPAPDSLCVISENNEMDKFNPDLMLEQMQTILNCLTIIDDMPQAAIGACDSYSFLVNSRALSRAGV